MATPHKVLKFTATHLRRLLERDTAGMNRDQARAKVIVEQGFKCKICGRSHWLGKPLTLELDHIDGDNQNNQRDNLRALCPNCHSQTPNWRGRNNSALPQRTLRNDRRKAALLGLIPPEATKGACPACGVVPRAVGRGNRKANGTFCDCTRHDCIRRYEAGESPKQIMATLHISSSTLYHWTDEVRQRRQNASIAQLA